MNRNANEKSAGAAVRVIPVVEENLKVGKRAAGAGITRIRTVVHERVETVDEPLLQDEVRVVRVPVNRYIEHPEEVSERNGTTIVPVMEEVLVVEKKLLLREELHITKKTTTVRKPQRIVLRKEEAVVEHINTQDRAREEKS